MAVGDVVVADDGVAVESDGDRRGVADNAGAVEGVGVGG